VTRSTSYLQTFRQHRRLLIAPIVVAVVIAGWSVLGAGTSYQSTASLWVDTPASTTSSVDNTSPTLTPPSSQEQSTLTELLATRGFLLGVGHGSLLGPYLAAHPSQGFGPSALLTQIGGAGSLNDRIMSALGSSQVTTALPGPQVLQISYSGPTAAVAQSTLRAIVSGLQQDSTQFTAQHNQAAAAYYRTQVVAAQKAIVSARQQASQYLSQHPQANVNDPNLSAVTTAEQAASAQLTQANANLSTAVSAGATGSVQVVDPPTSPPGPTSGMGKQLLGILGGLLAGLLISFLGTVALTRGKSDPWEDELAPANPVPVAAGPAAAPEPQPALAMRIGRSAARRRARARATASGGGPSLVGREAADADAS
jgi:hypothetical protein